MANFNVGYQAGNDSYANTMAAITRNQYQDYLLRFQPVEDQLIGLAKGNALYDAQIKRNSETASQNYQQAEQQAANASARYGLGDRRTEQQKTNLANTNKLSLASMNNESREAIGDLQRSLMTGGAASKQRINSLGGQ